jgi:hypothetical protein
LLATRHGYSLWPRRRRGLALPLSELTVRPKRQVYRPAGGIPQVLRHRPFDVLSGTGKGRRHLDLYWHGRAATDSRLLISDRSRIKSPDLPFHADVKSEQHGSDPWRHFPWQRIELSLTATVANKDAPC